MEGVDYSTARPNLDQLWAAGKRFVSRYLAYTPNAKVLTKTELTALHAKGFGVVLNWEQATGDMGRGRDVGVAHATEALKQANALGAPASVPIYFSADFDTNATSRGAVAAYLDGCASVLGLARVGVYGEADVIDAMIPAHATWGWQTYAWSTGRVSDKAHFYQYKNGVQLAGADTDLNRSLKDSFGAWFAMDYQPYGPPKRDVGARDANTMLADLWGRWFNGRSPWGTDPTDPIDGIDAKLARLEANQKAILANQKLILDKLDSISNGNTTDIETAIRNILLNGVKDA